MKREQFIKVYKEHFSGDSSIELVIQKLKDAGASMMECTRTLVHEAGIPLKDADEYVVYSNAWKDIRGNVERLRDEFGQALEEMEGDQ